MQYANTPHIPLRVIDIYSLICTHRSGIVYSGKFQDKGFGTPVNTKAMFSASDLGKIADRVDST